MYHILHSGLCMYHLVVWSSFNLLHNSQWITFPTQLCPVLYSFSTNLLHSLIMWLIVSSQSPHNQHLSFCCVRSFFALTKLVLIVLFCAAIRRDSFSPLRFPFHRHVRAFSNEILSVCHLKYLQSCFSSLFCYLVIFVLFVLMLSVLLPATKISLSLLFLM